MTVADELVEGLGPFWSQDLEDYLRAMGAMWAQLEAYAADPDEPDTDVFVYRPNWAPNPDFEHDALLSVPAGWGTPQLPGGASLNQWNVVSDWSYKGAHSARLRALTVPVGGTALIPVNGVAQIPVASGQPWRLAASFNVQSAQTEALVQLDFYDATGTFLITKGLTLSPVALGVVRLETSPVVVPTSGAFMTARIGLRSTANGAVTLDSYVDSAVLQQGWPITMAPFNGDDAGCEWEGIPGNSRTLQKSLIPRPGWSKMLDVDRADTQGLPYLAQWVGERLPAGLNDAAQRQWIRRGPNQWRGTMQGIADGIIPFLTGSQSVYMRERSKLDLTANDDWLAIITFASETPNQSQVYDHLRRKLVAADVSIDYVAASQETWTALQAGRTWTVIESGSPTWHQIESIQPGYIPAGFTLWTPSS